MLKQSELASMEAACEKIPCETGDAVCDKGLGVSSVDTAPLLVCDKGNAVEAGACEKGDVASSYDADFLLMAL
jgi:hypothetical protein